MQKKIEMRARGGEQAAGDGLERQSSLSLPTHEKMRARMAASFSASSCARPCCLEASVLKQSRWERFGGGEERTGSGRPAELIVHRLIG